MSPRAKILRKVINPPLVKGFKPYGSDITERDVGPVTLLYEEYEALRLCDYDHYNHHDASLIMGISRPTFTRIYSSTRQKIATAFVEGRKIAIEGGKVYFDSDWYHCGNCNCTFNNPEKDREVDACPLCGKQDKITSVVDEPERTEPMGPRDPNQDLCVCLQCGYSEPHRARMPCSHLFCPKCNIHLTRRTGLAFQQGRHRGRRNF